ncbi:aconitate hydratase AcnA [Rickettsiales bacterium]|nr:aconitate hydratase AcnA [Rickettsiales bacterium]
MNNHSNNFKSLDKINILDKDFCFYNINNIDFLESLKIKSLPISYKILLENLVRNFDNQTVRKEDIENLIERKVGSEIQFKPSRVLMQDYTGVPAVSDLAAMRDSVKERKKDPKIINPLVPVSLVIDHSIIVDNYGQDDSISKNVDKEFRRNTERYQLLKWAQSSFKNFKVFPPGSGICHQINLEFLSDVVIKNNDFLYFDSVVGTDSHTTMINSLSILGWGVGGIEAESVMLGQSISMLIPDVIGIKLSGELNEGITATDLVLSITQKLRKLGVVGKFVEFFGHGLKNLSLSERSTISNMAPEYGATCGIFPVDKETLDYLKLTGRNLDDINLIEKFSKIQGTWMDDKSYPISYDKVVEIKLDQIKAAMAGPKRPQDKINLEDVKEVFLDQLSSTENENLELMREENKVKHGSVCVAAITSCTNTSNPSVLIMAGLIAKKAIDLGIKIPSWVKTSLAPGSQVVEEYLEKANLIKPLNQLGFNIVGYGCTTCIGNSGPLRKDIEQEIKTRNLNVCSVISGNRNFEGRIHPLIKSNFLASPPLVMIYAIAGKVDLNIYSEPITSVNGNDLYLKDFWPLMKDVNVIMETVLSRKMYVDKYSKIFDGDENWEKIKTVNSETYDWSVSSTYIKKPPFLDQNRQKKTTITNAKPLLILGDSVTTDHISPAGVIKEDSATGKYLTERQVKNLDFNSFGARRGNHEIMVRGTFANVRINNKMVNKEGGYTIHYPSGYEDEVYNVAQKYEKEGVPLIVVAGKEYGTGSSRDWAAKGTKLLGIKVVIAESFERIHRSNLVGMGVLPLEMINNTVEDLGLLGSESFDIGDLLSFQKEPNIRKSITINYKDKTCKKIEVVSRIDTVNEINYFREDGILPYVLNKIS